MEFFVYNIFPIDPVVIDQITCRWVWLYSIVMSILKGSVGVPPPLHSKAKAGIILSLLLLRTTIFSAP